MNKTCTKCLKTKPMTSDFFRARKDSKDGYRNQCLDCLREYHRVKSQDWRKQNLEKVAEYRREWKQNNPVKVRAYKQRRKASKQRLANTLTPKQYIKTLTDFNYSCAYCGESNESHIEKHGHQLHQEHIVPLIVGGGYTKDNIIPACKDCNCNKSDKSFSDWYPKYDYYDHEREFKILQHITNNKDKSNVMPTSM